MLRLAGDPLKPAFGAEPGQSQEHPRSVRSAYDWFIEGFDTPDLKDAESLLDELA